MSPMIGTYLPFSVAVWRMISMRRTRSGGVPCEKLRRKTSTPEVSRRWMVSSVLQEGPRVAMILVLRNFCFCSLSRAKRGISGGAASQELTRAAAAPEILWRFAPQDKLPEQALDGFFCAAGGAESGDDFSSSQFLLLQFIPSEARDLRWCSWMVRHKRSCCTGDPSLRSG